MIGQKSSTIGRSAAFLLLLSFAVGLENKCAAHGELRCSGGARAVGGSDSGGAPATDFAPGRKYAPDRAVDILHVAIDVTPDFKARTISGATTIRFAPIARPARELRLDQVDLTIKSVEALEPAGVAIQGWTLAKDALVITFAETIPAGRVVEIRIAHSATPRKGIYFRTPEMGYAPGDSHLWSQGEPHEARHWFPSFDSPNEKFTSEVICRVPPEMTAFSNGRLIGEETDPATALKAVHWRQDKPHANYLIALAAGKFETVADTTFRAPLRFHTPPSRIAEARRSFKDTADMMRFFEDEIGVPYPWDKYDQVVVSDFIWGGMENTTLTILTDRTLFTEDYENTRDSTDLVAHELAHQWFGDYVTCKDWSQIWLNEGFATYYAHLYNAKKNGRDAFLYGMLLDAREIIGSGDTGAIVDRAYKTETDVFGVRAYQKGSWVLHMLRSRVGEELYRRAIKSYLENRALGAVATDDLRASFEKETGLSLDAYFDQWVHHGGWPRLKVDYEWNESERLARVVVEQTQEVNDKTLLFDFPVKLRFTLPSGDVDREIRVDAPRREFFFALPAEPEMVRFDPETALLAEIEFPLPAPMLHAQLKKSDAIGRIRAIEALGDEDDQETVDALRAALNEDAFWGARLEVAEALKKIHTPEALAALLASREQADARVRRRVAESLADYYEPDALRAAVEDAAKAANPDVRAAALGALAKFEDPDARKTLAEALKTDSYRDLIAEAALRAIRQTEDPALIGAVQEFLKTSASRVETRALAEALTTLAGLARHQEDKSAARQVLLGFLNDSRVQIRVTALRALGTLGDPVARAAVASFKVGRDDDPTRMAAEAALKKIDEVAKTPEELAALRRETADLKQTQEETQKALDELRGKLDALLAPPAEGAPAAAPTADAAPPEQSPAPKTE